MENQLSPEMQLLIKKIAISSIIAILLIVLTWLALSNAKVKSRDIERLSDIRILQAELKTYFFNNNVYPQNILNKKSLGYPEKECSGNLCLDFLPVDPLTGAPYKYSPCADSYSFECGGEIENPKGFKIEYALEGNSRAILAGAKRATANNIND